MPSPLGEGQTDMPINHLYLGEVPSLLLRTIPTIKIRDGFVVPSKGDIIPMWYPPMLSAVTSCRDVVPEIYPVCLDGSPLQHTPAIGTERRTIDPVFLHHTNSPPPS